MGIFTQKADLEIAFAYHWRNAMGWGMFAQLSSRLFVPSKYIQLGFWGLKEIEYSSR